MSLMIRIDQNIINRAVHSILKLLLFFIEIIWKLGNNIIYLNFMRANKKSYLKYFKILKQLSCIYDYGTKLIYILRVC